MATAKSPKAPKGLEQSQAPSSGTLDGVNKDGVAPARRVRDAKSLHGIYVALKDADDESGRNRAMADAMFDGEPPYDPAELEAAGQSQVCNLDFGEGESALQSALTGYYDLTNSVDVLARLHTRHGEDPNERAEWEQVMSEEFDEMLKGWPDFEGLFQRTCTEFVKHGVGICYHTDDVGWMFESTGLNGFYIPRTTKVGENHIEVAIAERTYPLHELYGFISKGKYSEGAGWNVEQVRKALVMASSGDDKPEDWRSGWETLQQNFKNNDLGASYASKGATVKVIHAWVKEFNGKVSHYVSLQNGLNEDFLFKKESRFDSMTDCFTIFTYGVGNGFYHSIRGLGFKLFPAIQVSNRLRSKAVDGAMFGSSTMVQPRDEKALAALELTYVGPFAILPPGFDVVDRALPNVGSQVLPVVHDLSMLIQNNTGSYRPRAVSADGQERTAKEVTLQAQQEATLSSASINLFYQPWTRLLRSVVKRLISGRLVSGEPGYAEAQGFTKRCIDRGVPIEAIKKVDRVVPTRAIGSGSSAVREIAFDQMLQLAGALDEVGKNRLLRDKFASKLGGYSNVDAYLPRIGGVQRQPVDAQIANLENVVFRNGSGVPVTDEQNDSVHTTLHMPPVLEAVQALDQLGQSPEGADPEQVKPILTFLHVAIPHVAEHVQKLMSDPLHATDAAEVKKILQEANGRMEAATANFEKAMMARQQEQAQAQQEQGAQADPKVQKMMAESQAKMQIAQQESQTKLQIKGVEAQQKMAQRDATTAQKIAAVREKARAQVVPDLGTAQAPRAAK
jgi:hypothetical protein